MPRSSASLRKRHSFTAWLRRKVGTRGSTVRDFPSNNLDKGHKGVFGVPLVESIKYAHRNMFYHDENDVVHRHAGAIPILVAKTGGYLKNNGLDTVGIFRLSGGLKRIAALQETFDHAPYGADVDWSDATVHDAATLLRRFLNQLPDAVIPHAYFQAFRDVMSDKNEEASTTEQRIDAFQHLIEKLPISHQHLLLYILDLLNLFARHADENKMDSANLAAVFCPAILSHPDHNTAVQYKISQAVVEFLIEFQTLFTAKMVVGSNTSSTTTTTTTTASSSITEPPPVPPLPDWAAANKQRGLYAERRALPPLDMAHVNCYNGKEDGDAIPDSGADVRTPAVPFAIRSNDEDSTLMSSKIRPRGQEIDPLQILTNHWHQVSKKIPKQPVAMAVALIVALFLSGAAYRSFTIYNLINWIVFFGGLAAYWSLLITGTKTLKPQKREPLPLTEQEDKRTEEQALDGDEAVWIDDEATEAAMLLDKSLMAEWGDLLKRTWRNDLSMTPASTFSRNQSSDYFAAGQEDQADSKADGASMMTIGSRYMEDSGSDDDTAHGDNDDDDENWSTNMTDEDLQHLWQQFQQTEKDQVIAEELQRQEEQAERHRDVDTNPFLGAPVKPRNTHDESWKIASAPLSAGK